MEKVRVLIVEDELLIAEDLKSRLEEHDFSVVDVFDNGEEAISNIKNLQPDLILMDIQLAGKMDGIETAKQIIDIYKVPIIYLSDHIDDKTVERAKTTFPANYIAKPFKTKDVLRALELAFFNASNSPKKTASKLTDRIFVRTDNQKSKMVLYEDILFLKAGRSYCEIITVDDELILSNNMGKVFEKFDNPYFIRTHKSYIVNINKITEIEGNMIKMGDRHVAQMSTKNRDVVLNRLNLIK
ncbi:MAG: response regulator [Fulvivirga sp.]|uniref:response regulator n=1 Tax=Fulvivirga sp. TaxID=1931237 RepID=UPI0032EB089E